MALLRIIVAAEPRLYCEVLTEALRLLRPMLDITSIDLTDLDLVLKEMSVDLVIACALPADRDRYNWYWLLNPNGESTAIIGHGGTVVRSIADIRLENILALIDELTPAAPSQ